MTTTSNNRSVGWFFLVVLLLSLPAYYVIAQWGPEPGVVLSLIPLPVALIFAARAEKGGAKRLLKRYTIKIPRMIWYLPTILLIPISWILADRVLSLFTDIPALTFPMTQLPTLIIVSLIVLVTGATEEIAWMGYAFDPMEDRWKTIKATLILAILWAAWHIPAFYLAGATVTYVAVFSINFIFWRVLIVWIYKNTGKTLLAASLFHAMGNITLSGLPLPSIGHGDGVSGAIAISVASAIAALGVLFLWGPELNKFRWSR
jgi:hypothetical protein